MRPLTLYDRKAAPQVPIRVLRRGNFYAFCLTLPAWSCTAAAAGGRSAPTRSAVRRLRRDDGDLGQRLAVGGDGQRAELLACGDDIPDVGDDYTLQAPETVRGRVRLRRPSLADARSPLCAGADGQRRDWQRYGPRRVAAGRRPTAPSLVYRIAERLSAISEYWGVNRRAINSNCPSPARPRLTFTRYS